MTCYCFPKKYALLRITCVTTSFISQLKTLFETTTNIFFYQLHPSPVIFLSIHKNSLLPGAWCKLHPCWVVGGGVGLKWVGSGCWVAWHLALIQQKMAARTLGPTKKHREIPNGISIIIIHFRLHGGIRCVRGTNLYREWRCQE